MSRDGEPTTVAVVTPPRELDANSAHEFASRIQTALEQFPDVLVVDLTDAAFVGVSAIDILIDAKTVLDHYGGRMKVRGATSAVQRILALAPGFHDPGVVEDPPPPHANGDH